MCGVFGEEPLEVAVVVSGYDVYGYCVGDGAEEFFDVDALLAGDLWNGVFDVTKDNELVWVVVVDEFKESCDHARCLGGYMEAVFLELTFDADVEIRNY